MDAQLTAEGEYIAQATYGGTALINSQLNLVPPELLYDYNFDLNNIVDPCMEILSDKTSGLIGFAIPCKIPGLSARITERIKQELGRGKTHVKSPLTIDPTFNTATSVLTTIKTRYTLGLNSWNVVFSVHTPDNETAQLFWDQLSQNFNNEFEHLFVVFLAVEPDFVPCGGLMLLQQPKFLKMHAITWVRKILPYFKWQNTMEIEEYWIHTIVLECREGDELNIIWVYEHLTEVIDVIRTNPDPSRFRQELEVRRMMYEQTSN